MARSKNLHIVRHSFAIEQPDSDDIHDYVANGQIDLSLLLSEKYGRNIRQGNNFRLVGWGASAQPTSDDSTDFDMGAAGLVSLTFQEPNKHYVKAWRQMLKIWQKQKQLMGRVGKFVRYDDFELAYSADFVDSRTSVIYDDPITVSDGDPHQLVLTGQSDEANDITSIVSYYNGRFEALPPSETQYGTVIKEAKFDTDRPLNTDGSRVYAGWAASAGVTELDITSFPFDAYFGGNSQGGMTFLPPDNHLNVMCGLVDYAMKMWPPDTVGQIADTVSVTITLVVEGWSPLAKTSKRRSKK